MGNKDSLVKNSVKIIRSILMDNRELDSEKISFFNSIIPGCRNPLVVKTPILTSIVKDIWNEYKTDLQAFLSLCDQLWIETKYYEEKKIVILLLEKIVGKSPDILLKKVLEYHSDLYTWDLVDQFGMRLCSELLRRDFTVIKNFKHWVASEDLWIRRLSLVCFVRLRNIRLSSDQWSEIELVLEPSWKDNEHYVKKAMSWCLRELSKMNSDKVTDFICNNLTLTSESKKISKPFIKSCIRKLPNTNQDENF